jgi:hypothetical protein
MGREPLTVFLQGLEGIFGIVEQEFAIPLVGDPHRCILRLTLVVGDDVNESSVGACPVPWISMPRNSLIRVDFPDE